MDHKISRAPHAVPPQPPCGYPAEGPMAGGDTAPEFTDQDVRAIANSLPDTVDPRRLKLLPDILYDWSSNDLREHLQRAHRGIPERHRAVVAVGKRAGDLLRALKAVDEVDLAGIAGEMVRATTNTSLIASWAETSQQF
jgi:hypothetical protein